MHDEMTGKKYPVRMILRVIDYGSATYYVLKGDNTHKKRGPATPLADSELKNLIKKTMKSIPFYGTGYKKIHARMQRELLGEGLSVGKNRVLRLMKEDDLLNKTPGGSGSSRIHDGKLITDAPDVMWGTDGKKFFTRRDGWCWLFDVADHFNSEIIGHNVVKYGDRFEATRAVQNAIMSRYGNLEKEAGAGLTIRCDLGSQYTAKYFINTMKFYGVEISPSWARSPECNGIIERFHRTIEEQLFSMNDFETLEEAEQAIREFITLYNNEWQLERLNYKSPVEAFNEYKKLSLKCAC
jgi:transposase InsO family protein